MKKPTTPKKPKSLWGAPMPTVMTPDGELSLKEAAAREREQAAKESRP